MKLVARFLILPFFIVIFFSTPFDLIYANETEQLGLPETTVNPGSVYYSFKRLFEKGQEKLLFFQQSKKSFYESLVKMRLSELNYVIDKKALSEVQRSSERFAYQAGILAEEVIKQNQTNDKENLIKEFDRYNKFLSNLRDKYPANSSFWMLVQHDINTLNILSNRLK